MAKITSVSEYIDQFDGIVKAHLDELNSLIMQLAPEAVSSISYGMPAYKLDGKILIYFSAAKEHLGVYPGRIETYDWSQKVKAYASGKSTLQFKHAVDLPKDILTEFICYRIKEIRG